MSERKIRMSLEISESFSRTLDELASEIGGERSDVLRKAIALLEIAVAAPHEKLHISLVDEHGNEKTKIVGLINDKPNAPPEPPTERTHSVLDLIRNGLQ